MFALKHSAIGLAAGLAVVLSAPVAAQADEPPAPSVTTLAATGVTGTTATFHAKVVTNNTPTTGYFVYGTAPDQLTQRTSDISFVVGSGEAPLEAAVSGLLADTKYYVVAVAENDDWIVTGGLESFSTFAPPAILGSSVTDITQKTATLRLNVATHGQPVTVSGCVSTARRLGVVYGCSRNNSSLAHPIGPYSVTADGDVAIPLGPLAVGTAYGWSTTVTNIAGEATANGAFRTEALLVMPSPALTPMVATYGSGVTISGTIPNEPGLVVTLAEQAYPFNGPIGPLAGTTATTDATGAFTFDLLAERPAAYGVTADGAVALAAGNLARLKVAPAVTAKAKRARRHRFVVAGRYQPLIASKVSLYRRGVGRVGVTRTSRGTFRFPARVLKPGKYEVRVTPAASTGFERAKTMAITIPRR